MNVSGSDRVDNEHIKGIDYLILDEYLPHRLLYVTAQVTQIYDVRYKKELGISIPESRVIHVLARNSEISSREICRMTTLAKSRVSVALQRLEAAGILTREPNANDQRLVSLQFTAKGNVLRKKLVRLAIEMETDIIKLLGKKRTADLEQTLDILRRHLDESTSTKQQNI